MNPDINNPTPPFDEGQIRYTSYVSLLSNEIMIYMVRQNSKGATKHISVVHLYCNCNEGVNNNTPPPSTHSIPAIQLY